jgi:hypothetical protein
MRNRERLRRAVLIRVCLLALLSNLQSLLGNTQRLRETADKLCHRRDLASTLPGTRPCEGPAGAAQSSKRRVYPQWTPASHC